MECSELIEVLGDKAMIKVVRRLTYLIINKNISLNSYLILSFVFISLAPLIISSYIYYIRIEKTIKEDAVNSSDRILSYINADVDNYLNEIENTCVEVLSDPMVTDYIRNKPESDNDLYYKRRQLLKELQKVNNYRHFHSIIIYPVHGYLFSMGIITETSIDDYKRYSVYNDAVKANGNPIFVHLHEYKGEKATGNKIEVFSYARSFKDINSGSLLGVIEITFEEKEISSIIARSSNNNLNKIYLVSEEKKVVSSTTNNLIGSILPEYASNIIDDAEGGKIVKTEQGKKLIMVKMLQSTNWRLVEEIEYDNLLKSALAMQKFFIFIIFVVIAFLSVIILVAVLALTNSVRNIIEVINQIKEGNMEARTRNILFSEFSFIGYNINEMAKRIARLIENIITEQKQKSDMELKMLQAQITPHFLYNTLYSISCMARNRNNNDIAVNLDALITLLKTAVSVKTDMLTIKEELKMVECYIALEKTRSNNKFGFNYTITSDLNDWKIPKMVLQPIVENCIMHGFVGEKDNYEIEISIEGSGDDILIKVFDNGEGMDMNEVESIIRTGQQVKRNKFSGIGIENVDQKIKLYFGERYGLTIVSEKGEGTLISVLIPKVLNEWSGEHA